ncbi:hypothetical protein NDU88_002261 [Pleurodeles waltl]|uniref:Uncharacterized protein n=1 Tax=Pleurodeles waltl TaxID=8319 RepID=A0AAV7UV21_PLEWA|nr:hypothetical protein NDU88_002261 [Pleurodeles waltl]
MLSAKASRALNTRVKYLRNGKRAPSRGPDASPEEKCARAEAGCAEETSRNKHRVPAKSTRQNVRKQ